nr:transmembrane protease serine 9-like [Aedes albopictus]
MTNTFTNPRSGASYNTKSQTTKKITLVDTAAAVNYPTRKLSTTVHTTSRPDITFSPPPVYSFERLAVTNPTTTLSTTLHTTAKPVTTSSPPTKKQDMCGTNNLVTDVSINGKPHHQVGRFPWAVPLFRRNSTSDPEYFCAGTIITDRHILTAAHCVKNMDPEDVLAIPGKHNISDLSAKNGAVHANVEQIVYHEDYDGDSEHLVDQDADIAILRLERPLHNHKGVVSGWGETENGPTNIPFYYTSTIVSKEQCGDNFGFSIPNRARIFCGDGSGSVACKGDSGSALAMKRKNRFYLRGVVSKAILDEITLKCDADKYAIYIDVPKFMPWILAYIDDDDDDYDY